MHVYNCLKPLQGGRPPACKTWQKWVKLYGNAKGTNKQDKLFFIYILIIYIAVIEFFY